MEQGVNELEFSLLVTACKARLLLSSLFSYVVLTEVKLLTQGPLGFVQSQVAIISNPPLMGLSVIAYASIVLTCSGTHLGFNTKKGESGPMVLPRSALDNEAVPCDRCISPLFTRYRSVKMQGELGVLHRRKGCLRSHPRM